MESGALQRTGASNPYTLFGAAWAPRPLSPASLKKSSLRRRRSLTPVRSAASGHQNARERGSPSGVAICDVMAQE
jgi:hypothetical protein